MKRITTLVFSALIAALMLVLFGCAGGQAPKADNHITITDEQEGEEAVDAPKLTELDGEGSDAELAPSSLTITPNGGSTFPRDKRECTIMVYMVGTDLESTYGSATEDLYEMAESGFDDSRFNVVVFTGGSKYWHSNVPNDRNCVVEVANDGARIVARTPKSYNMGASETLASFITWANQNYPADRTALVLWDHGGGPALGYGVDRLFESDSLSLAETKQAMEGAGYGEANKLDWIGYDACLMGSLEVMQAWTPYARYFIGSEEIEAGPGWDYSFLRSLGKTSDAADETRSVVESFGAFYKIGVSDSEQPDATLSSVDLSKLGGVEKALDGLAEAVVEDFSEGDYVTVARARAACRWFGDSKDPDLIDLVDFAERTVSAYPDKADQLLKAIDAAIVANASNIENAHGISLYFPRSELSSDVVAPTARMQDMVGKFSELSMAALSADWSSLNAVHEGGSIALNLSSTQASSLVSAYYTVLENYQGRGWLPVLCDVAVERDGEGRLLMSDDPLVVCAKGSKEIAPFRQVDASSNRAVYRCESASLIPGSLFIDPWNGEQKVDVNVVLDDTSGNVNVVSVSQAADEKGVYGRSDIDVSRYEDLQFYRKVPLVEERNANGEVLPYDQWNSNSGNHIWGQVALGDSLGFEAHRISELNGVFAVQFCVTDINGTVHASEVVELTGSGEREAVVDTEKGQLSFVLRGDHAELTSYAGNDESLAVPEEVDGLPVTAVAENALSYDSVVRELTLPSTLQSIGAGAFGCHSLERVDFPSSLISIGDSAFLRCSKLAQVELPEGLVSIGQGAFSGAGVKSVQLPASLEIFGEGAFTACTSLTGFEVAAGCSAVKEADGVLYSSDGATLLVFPAGREGSYSIQADARAVGYGAFAYCKLDAITFPEGLTRIDNCAFYCDGVSRALSFSEVKLPESLESVGTYAFGAVYNGAAVQNSPYIESLHLGAKVDYIGEQAFSGLRLGSFDVDGANPTFTSPGGLLANAAGDTVLEAPRGIDGPVCVPDGVTTLGKDVFTHCPDGTDFVVPPSVFRISKYAFPYQYEDNTLLYGVRLHGEAGSAIETFAALHDIPFDNVTDPGLLQSERVTVDQDGIRLDFDVFGDQAALVGVDGSGASEAAALAIPSEIAGVPVTRVTDLRGSARRFDAWTTVVLPHTLESIDPVSLDFLRSLNGFELDGDSEAFEVAGGVLFSKGGDELVAFALADPAFTDEEAVFAYEIPEGTKTIGSGAFRSSQLESVTFASSVRTVRAEAFAYNSRLRDIGLNEGLARVDEYAFNCPATSIALPSSLGHVGDGAFNLKGFENLKLPDKLTHLGSYCFYREGADLFPIGSNTLAIGRMLEEIGPRSLSSLDVEAFEVSKYNSDYRSIDGLLTSRDRTNLILCPAGCSGELRIPDGIEQLSNNCLEKAVGITDVYFPESVVAVDAYASFNEGSAAASVTFHCKRGSAAQLYASVHGIKWVEQ